MKTRIDNFEYIFIDHKKGRGFNLTIEPYDGKPEHQIYLDYETAKKLVDYIKEAWEEIDEELLRVICGEVK
jgi:hypothetical protein